jgi:hypothetical protein
METAAEVQKRLYDAREQQMQREHQLQTRQLEVQQMREKSEVRIQELQLRGQQVALAIQRAQLVADIGRLGLSQQRDDLSQQVAGASGVPGLGGGSAFFGRTGRMSLAAGYGMVDVRGGDRSAVAQDAMDIIRANSSRGVQTLIGGDLSGDVDATRLSGEQLAQAVSRGIDRHANRVGRGTYAIDLIAPVGTPVGIPLSGVSNRGGATGVAGSTPRGNLGLHLTENSASGPGGAAGAPALPPANTNPKLLKAMQAAYGAGFRGENLIKMTAVAMAESSGNPNETNMQGQDRSYGLWQINMKDGMGPQRRQQFGLASNEALFDPATNARVAKGLFDERGFQPWRNSYGNANYQRWIGQARAVAPSVMGGAVGVDGGVTSTANQAQALQQGLQGLTLQETRLTKALEELVAWLAKLGDAQALEKENLTEQQLAERAQFEYEQRKALLTAEVMKTPQGQLGVAAGNAVSGSISGSLSGALGALLNGGDVRQAVASALAQAGQSLMQATLDALLNPLLAEMQKGLFKAITGVDVEALALQKAGTDLTAAAFQLMRAGTVLAGNGGTGAAAVNFASNPFAIAGKLLGAVGGFGGAMGLDFGIPGLTGIPNYSSAFTPGLAGGGEIQYGLDYLVGEKNAEIVRFNQSGGKVYSNRALTQALGVPFQRAAGGSGAEVADGGGDSLGVPFMGAGSTRAAAGRSTPGIPFLKASTGGSAGNPGVPGSAGAGSAAMASRSSVRLSLETQVINGIEYATVEQVREAAAAAAQAGRDSAYDGMRNNPSIQRSLGMRG